MPSIARTSTIAAALTIAALACVPKRATQGSATPYPLSPTPSAWVDRTLARMTLRQKAAQMVWPRTYGNYVADDADAWRALERDAREDSVGGFIISVGSPLEIAATLNALQRASALPLLVGSDLEAGAGFRARGGYNLPNGIDLGGAPLFPPNMAMAAGALGALAAGADSAAAARLVSEEGRATAAEGRALGIQLNFAPVVDVNNNPANPVINTRSYGADPHLVAWLAAAYVRGLQGAGATSAMVATAKHFPGHGDTDVNSHLALPVIGASRARLDSVELVPFRAAVGAGVGAVMSFHGAVTALDPSGDPATLSAPVLTGLLRRDMGFRGLVVSDAMDMRGVLDKYGAVEAAKRAVAAGADVLIQPESTRQTIDAVVAGVAEGRYPAARIDSSARRILALKQSLGLDRRRTVDLDAVRAVVGDSAHEALARDAAAQAMTLVRDSFALVPMRRLNAGARVLSVTIARRYDLPAGTAFDAELARVFPALRRELVVVDDPAQASQDYWRLLHAADSADVTLVGVYATQNWDATNARAPRSAADFVKQLAARGARPAVIAFGNPYLLQDVPEVPAYLVAWGGSPLLQRAAARALLGAAPITGRLPIEIPGAASLGAGLTR